jgi:hypothetical protein
MRSLARALRAILRRQNGAAGEPLCLEYRRIQAMSCRGNRRVRIDPDGKVFVDVASRDCPHGTNWNGPWPTEPARVLTTTEMVRLRDTITSSGFFDLPPLIERAGHDGYRDELDVALGARRNAVTVVRAPVPPSFARVQSAVLAAAGD